MKSKNNTTPAERGTIYTLGYSRPEAAAQLSRLMRNPRALLVDVRFQPLSGRSPQWNRTALSARFGKRYIWEQRLGNSQYRSRHLDIQLSAGYQDAIREAVVLLCSGTSLVLLCTCADERACHRSYVAKLIQDDLPVPLAAREVCG